MTTYTKTTLNTNAISKEALNSNSISKNPINSERGRGRILTDILDQILVGENKDEILVYSTGSLIKSPLNETFIRSAGILTDNLDFILVGELEDQILIYRELSEDGFLRSALSASPYTKQAI